MPDRRQGDRRDNSGIQNKQVKISLPIFIMIIVVVASILVSIIVCSIFSKQSYDKGYKEGYKDGYYAVDVNSDLLDLDSNLNPEELNPEDIENSSDSQDLELENGQTESQVNTIE